MRRLRLAILSAALCALSGGFELCAQSAQFSYHLSNREVQTFAQDADGYIWIGTARGLNRYNGTNYAIFYAGSAADELNSNNILSLTLDSSGRLWTGTECGIGYYWDGRFHHYANTVYFLWFLFLIRLFTNDLFAASIFSCIVINNTPLPVYKL